jgi:hypothetical protein
MHAAPLSHSGRVCCTVDEMNLESDAFERMHHVRTLIQAHEAVVDVNGDDLKEKGQPERNKAQ